MTQKATKTYDPAKGEAALLVIDVQAFFCAPRREDMGNKDTEQVARRIKRLTPLFRKAAMPVYLVFTSDSNVSLDKIDFYKLTPEKSDTLVRKTQNSAFAHTNLKKQLHENGSKLLLICGFNTSACVYDTACDGQEAGFDVALLEDMTANGNHHPISSAQTIEEMKNIGISIVKSREILTGLENGGPLVCGNTDKPLSPHHNRRHGLPPMYSPVFLGR